MFFGLDLWFRFMNRGGLLVLGGRVDLGSWYDVVRFGEGGLFGILNVELFRLCNLCYGSRHDEGMSAVML